MLRCNHASYRRRNVFEAAIHTKPGASRTHEPPSGGPHIGGAPATPIASLSGSTHKAPGSAGGYLQTRVSAFVGCKTPRIVGIGAILYAVIGLAAMAAV